MDLSFSLLWAGKKAQDQAKMNLVFLIAYKFKEDKKIKDWAKKTTEPSNGMTIGGRINTMML